jgi:LPS O-antigen subunit length determinant protein (WzzB/FepE family)
VVVPKVHPRPAEEQEARQPAVPAGPKAQVALADASTTATGESPARALQAHLTQRIEAPEAPDARWSPRRTLLFVLTVCGGFWLAVGAVLRLWLG